MIPVLADAINFPIVLESGLVILIPLIAFEVFVEAWILKLIWKQPFEKLCSFTTLANCCSLIAGIPTKAVNSWLYGFLLPKDLPSYFTTYPRAVATGSLIYFCVTVLVEVICGYLWRRRKTPGVSGGRIWMGLLLANVVTYAVLAPVHYLATCPHHEVTEFSSDVRWSRHPQNKTSPDGEDRD